MLYEMFWFFFADDIVEFYFGTINEQYQNTPTPFWLHSNAIKMKKKAFWWIFRFFFNVKSENMADNVNETGKLSRIIFLTLNKWETLTFQ